MALSQAFRSRKRSREGEGMKTPEGKAARRATPTPATPEPAAGKASRTLFGPPGTGECVRVDPLVKVRRGAPQRAPQRRTRAALVVLLFLLSHNNSGRVVPVQRNVRPPRQRRRRRVNAAQACASSPQIGAGCAARHRKRRG